MIFETERLLIRKLILEDLKAFHELESNPNVLKYATGEAKSFEENKAELKALISKYSIVNNDFWIYAIEKKTDNQFVGTVALVKDNLDDEIGYRFLEKFWRFGYGSEICQGIISYCKQIKKNKIVGYVVDKNRASAIILVKNNFQIVHQFINKENQKETKYELKL